MLFCDKNANEIKTLLGKEVISYDEAKMRGIPFVIAIANRGGAGYKEIVQRLEEDRIEYYADFLSWIKQVIDVDATDFGRESCAVFHVNYMNDYFDIAEEEESLRTFWENESAFYNMFKKLELENVVELACGRGRHVPQYLYRAGEVTLVDILEKNIEFCKERFAGVSNIHYYKNNGKDLSELQSNSYSLLFTYDSMVHFELMDIINYLQETYRILTPGGMALFHHSNDSSDYRNSFVNCTNPHGRNFMDKKLFAHLAYRAGFQIVEQKEIDWGIPNLDCISLVRK